MGVATGFRAAACHIGLWASIALSASAAHAAPEHCDRSLPAPPNDAYAYRDRGDRCEGRFIREVGSTTLLMASFTSVFEAYDAAGAGDWTVTWPALTHAHEVQLRAQGLRRRLYYRMDTQRPADALTFAWPTELMSALSVGPRDYGLVVTTALTVGPATHQVLLPARVARAGTEVPVQAYELVVLPGVQLDELSLEVLAVESDGTTLRVVRPMQPLSYGYYPPERAITITLPLSLLSQPGLYRADLAAQLVGGGVSRNEVWFFHPGP